MKRIYSLILALALIGLLVNLIPMFTYASGPYLHEEYKNNFSQGTTLEYYGIFGLFPTNKGAYYDLGITINVTAEKAGSYSIQSKLYQINTSANLRAGFNGKLLPAPPFFGASVSQIADYSGDVNSSGYSLIGLLFPSGNSVSNGFQNFNISSSGKYMSPNSYLGLPTYYFGNTSISRLEVNYVNMGSQRVMSTFVASDSNDTIGFFSSLVPNFSFNQSNMGNSGPMILTLGGGNSVPAQNWLAWFEYGFNFAFPLNVILFLASGIIAVYLFRKVS